MEIFTNLLSLIFSFTESLESEYSSLFVSLWCDVRRIDVNSAAYSVQLSIVLQYLLKSSAVYFTLFLPARRYASAVLAVEIAGCPSHAVIVSERQNLS